MQRFTVTILVSLICISLVACSGRVAVGYQPPVLPIKISIDTNGELEVSWESKVQTPIGTFSLEPSTNLSELYKDKNGVLIVNPNGVSSVYDLNGQKDVIVTLESGYYRQIELRKEGNNWYFEAIRVSTDLATPEEEPKTWLPGLDNIPSELYLSESSPTSNEQIAKYFDNPNEILGQLEAWGRITGYFQYFLHDEGCNSKTGLREIDFNAVLYQTDSGAQQALEWFMTNDSRRAYLTRPEPIDGIGDKAYSVWFTTTDDCDPQGNLDFIEIGFRRHNKLGTVAVGNLAGTVSKADLQSLAVRLAEIIDSKIVANSK